MPGPAFEVVRGPAPLVLIAPHGGRRDPVRRPWTAGGLKTNDLHTATLTAELAVATAASALVNTGLDRNDVDLNRVTTAHDAAPEFLEALAALLEASLDRHGTAVVLTIHGWNVIQTTVDLGIGYRPGRHPPGAPPGPTASPEFVGGALRALGAALESRGITVAFGARYPARARENLLQLFTARYLDDPRPLVRRLARLGQRCEGVQLELGVPLRWPGPWRRQLLGGLVEALPALAGRGAGRFGAPSPRPEPQPGTARSLEFVGDDLCGLVACDRAGARLLLFEDDGTLGLFTGERLGGEADGRVGGLELRATAGGGHGLRYAGPVARFPDTTPFLDLEAGLADAAVADATCSLDHHPLHAGCPFGSILGSVTLAGRRRGVRGMAVADHGDPRLHTRWRTALAIGAGEHLLLRSDHGASPGGFLCRDGVHLAVVDAERSLDGDGGARVAVRLESGEERTVDLAPRHRLPVVRGGATPPVRVEFASYRVAKTAAPAGWGFSLLPARPDA